MTIKITSEDELKVDIKNRFLNACDKFVTNCLDSSPQEDITPGELGPKSKSPTKTKGPEAEESETKEPEAEESEAEESGAEDRSIDKISVESSIPVSKVNEAKKSSPSYGELLASIKPGLDHNFIFSPPGPGQDSIQKSIIDCISDNSGSFAYKSIKENKKFQVDEIFENKEVFKKGGVTVKYNASLSIPNDNTINEKTLVIVKFYDESDAFLTRVTLYLDKLCSNLDFSFKEKK